MRTLSLALFAVLAAACNAAGPGASSSSRAVQGQITDSTVQAVFAETSAGQQTVAAVGIDGRFVLNVPVQTPVRLVTATRNVAGGFTAVKHIGPNWFTLQAGPLLDIGVVHQIGTGTITETPGTADAGTADPTHMCPNTSSSGSDDDGDHGDDGHSGGDDGSSNSGEGMADGGSSSGGHDGSDCHESDDDTCGGMTVSGCSDDDDRDDCDNEDAMQPVDAADAGIACRS